ncbi:hypothetical protein LCGC14_2342390 [marine sediment metagenome]|uniref:Uncharacterized protein n=1 Tax=marine sediment metagenome TaxID=412755 RepID=A0A0F9CBL1_9ZZZZ
MIQSYMNRFIDVILGTTGALLFTVEMQAIPESGSIFTYTPLSGPDVKYRVDDIDIKVTKVQTDDPGPIPDPPSIGFAARITVEVSVVIP